MSSIVKIIEVIAQSEQGFAEAVASAVEEASKTVHNIKSVWVDNLSCEVEGGKVKYYRVNAKLSFVVEGHT
jgi:dodecin